MMNDMCGTSGNFPNHPGHDEALRLRGIVWTAFDFSSQFSAKVEQPYQLLSLTATI
jgi:hypothetical protein